MSELLNAMKEDNQIVYTTNGAAVYNTTQSKVYDMFAQGGAMRFASNDDCIMLFKEAYEENPTMALKCLFWLRDIRGGAGERRFFRVCFKWLATYYAEEIFHLLPLISNYGRYDDLFELFDTFCERAMVEYIKRVIDENEDHLIYKWMPSINTSSQKTRERAHKFARYFGMTDREYRKMLSAGRRACNLVETLMSQNKWDEIAFDKLPSRAGLLYKNAFLRREETSKRYREFISDSTTKVNARTLYPYDVVKQAAEVMLSESNYYGRYDLAPDVNDPSRLAINKYWDNLTDYFNGATLNALCVCDTSGSMTMTAHSKIAPITVAISLALYTAERAQGPFHNHFISFSSRPKLLEVKGVDFCDKVDRIYRQNLCENTNIEATFDLILNTAWSHRLKQTDIPNNIIVISDMQFDAAQGYRVNNETLFDRIRSKWEQKGYIMPHLIFWNVNAASGGGNIPIKDDNNVTYVSGASPSILTSILTGKTGIQLMYETLNTPRYSLVSSIKM